MSRRLGRLGRLGSFGQMGFAGLILLGICEPLQAQNVLPEIIVRAPSPIVRRASQPGPLSLTGQAPAAATLPSAGALPIITDQFATVTVVPKEEIQRKG